MTLACTLSHRRYIRIYKFLFLNRSLFQRFFSFIPFANVLTKRYWCHSQKHESHSSCLSPSQILTSDLPPSPPRLHVLHSIISRCVSTFFKCCPLPQNYFSRRVQYNLACRGEGLEFSLQNFRHLERPNTCRVGGNLEQLSNEFGPS